MVCSSCHRPRDGRAASSPRTCQIHLQLEPRHRTWTRPTRPQQRAVFPCQFTVASLSGRTWQRLQKETGFDEWQHRGFCSTDQHFVEHYKDGTSHRKQGLVYLTSDSDNIISHLETDKIYIIGGIVDRNRLKGIALHKAKEYNICHARLPLETCLAKLPTTKVLTCNHVFGILLKYREHGSDWAKALQDVLPSRKAAEY